MTSQALALVRVADSTSKVWVPVVSLPKPPIGLDREPPLGGGTAPYLTGRMLTSSGG